MQQTVRITGRSLECMSKSMAEIKQRAIARLALVTLDDVGLHAAGTCHGVFDPCHVAAQRLGTVGLQPLEEGCIAQRAVFHHFGIDADVERVVATF